MAEEISPSEIELKTEPTFLKAVAQMATLAEEAIRKLRTETHLDKFKFADLELSYLFPNTIHSVDSFSTESLARLETVVNDYLTQTARFGLNERGDSRAGNAVEENTVTFAPIATEWMKKVYTSRKEEIDARVDELSKRISGYATREIRDTVFGLGFSSSEQDQCFAVVGKPELSLEELTGKMYELKTRFYETELPHPEDLAKLYELCFNAEVKQRGWEELDDGKLATVLAEENVPLELFGKYTGREIKLPEESKSNLSEMGKPKRKGTIEVIKEIIRTPTPIPVIPNTSSFIARDYVEGSNYLQALQALRTSYASRECPNQPTVTINGQTYVRPPTLYEVLKARVEDFNCKTNPDGTPRDGEDPLRFFKVWLDSCTGRHYKRGTTKFKIIPVCPQLITLSAGPRADYLELPYADSVSDERDSSNGKYGVNLSKSEVLEHSDWLFVTNENRALLGETFDIIKRACGGNDNWKGMAFYINQAPQNDELRPLFVDNHNCHGNANGGSNLHGSSRFLRV